MAHPKRSIDGHLDEWLRDAHAMEEQASTMLAAMARRLGPYPDLKQRIEQHLGETREQLRLIRECIGRRGSEVSALKDLGARGLAALQGFAGMLAADEVVKGVIACHAFENFEIATYRALITAARMVGDVETITVCERILPQEVAMANWLEQHLPQVVSAFLARNPERAAASR
ncbi:ferritin-like domain-containing protein [Burkholderia glumae]|uniref:ferritin-like domain-containing protein n=1 Tax=Burkholderia glumae TaxID=337 RepID=UPI001463AC69|nr:ferritin-like domain-containing protein [Burkholderia glumae]QJP69757.1 ferritin-like domain-containing protein [Burkholderia glumae]